MVMTNNLTILAGRPQGNQSLGLVLLACWMQLLEPRRQLKAPIAA
jgi:hypothetical protein